MVPGHIALVRQGLLRLYYQRDGQEQTILFFAEGGLAGDYFGFLTQSPSLRPVQALEDCDLLLLSHTALNQLYQRPAWKRIGRRLSEQAYIFSVVRANRLVQDSYETRYATFVAENPD